MLQDITIPDNEQPDILGEMLDAALATRPGPVRTSPYCEARQEAVDDLELAAEWQVSADALLADENQGLRMLARQRANVDTHTAWLESQLADARRKKHAAEARVVDLERQLAEALMAAQARIAELEAAVRIAEPAPVSALVNGFDAAHYHRMWTLERACNDQMRKQLAIPTSADLVVRAGERVYPLASQADAHEDDDDATLATLGDRRQQEARSIEWTPPTRSKPDAAA